MPGTYTVVATNYAGGSAEDDWTGEVNFEGPVPATYTGLKEAWTLTCAKKNGRVVNTQEVIVDRGRRFDAGNACKPGFSMAKR